MRIDILVSIDIKFKKNPIFFKQLIYLEVEKKKIIYIGLLFLRNSIKSIAVIRRIHSKLFRKVQPEEVNLENLNKVQMK